MTTRAHEAAARTAAPTLWCVLLGGAVGWSLHLLVMYPLAPLACDLGSALPLHVATAVAVAGVTAAIAAGWRVRRRTADGEGDDLVRRVRFMVAMGLIVNVAFLGVIVLTWLPVLAQDPCVIAAQRSPRAALDATGLAAALAPAPAHAHEVPAAPGASVPRTWRIDPLVVASLAVAAGLYVRGVTALWRRRGGRRAAPPARLAAFGGGAVALAVALLSPLDALAGALFSAHMVQHLLLVLVAAPLLVLAEPLVPWLWAVPARARVRLGRWWRRARLARAAWRWLGHPATAVVLHAIALWAWHAPALYDAAVASRALHALEHASFLATALLFWWAVAHAGRAGGPGHGPAVLGVFVTAMHSGALGALITFAGAPWYTAHAGAPAWGRTPLEDQQLAGVIMWAPASLVYVGAGLALFVGWLRAAERRAARREASPGLSAGVVARAAPATLALGAALALGACGTPYPARQVMGGDAAQGRDALAAYGCGGCHVIPGVRGARGRVAPPLTDFGHRAYIAGTLTNDPENLVTWIQDPKGVHGRTAMPDLGVGERDARDMAAYLYTLRRRR